MFEKESTFKEEKPVMVLGGELKEGRGKQLRWCHLVTS
jgi:hypothetical protein